MTRKNGPHLLALAIALVVGATTAASSEDLASYVAQCRSRIGWLPVIDCLSGKIIPITVDGVEVQDTGVDVNDNDIPKRCDRPAKSGAPTETGRYPVWGGNDPDYPAGRCVPFSRALLLRDDNGVQATAICRRKHWHPANDGRFEEIDVILHSVRTGSTCWFLAMREANDSFEASPAPALDSAEAKDFWRSPSDVAREKCSRCHDSSPYMYSPYIGQVWRQVPTDPFGRYANDIGADFAHWPDPIAMTPARNTCIGCHRIGVQTTCDPKFLDWTQAIPQKFQDPTSNAPHSYSMPLLQNLTPQMHEESVLQLGRCCGKNRPADCPVSPIPGAARR
jgi:hypothetical protein